MKTIVVMTTALFLSGTFAFAQVQKPAGQIEPAKTATVKHEAAQPVTTQPGAKAEMKAEPAKSTAAAAQTPAHSKTTPPRHHKTMKAKTEAKPAMAKENKATGIAEPSKK